MRKTKAKRDATGSGRFVPYIVMYIMIAAVGIFLTSSFIMAQPYRYFTREQIETTVFMMGFIPALLHVQLAERFLKRSMRGWLICTMLGTLITVLIFSNGPGRWPESLERLQIYLIITAPTLLLQTFWLWTRFKKAWLLSLSALIPIFFLSELPLSFDLDDSFLSTGPYAALYAVVPALLMYHILAQPKDSEKAKVDLASEDEEARIERLKEHERRTLLWDRGDDQALQSEA